MTSVVTSAGTERHRIAVTGVVQGVGFRPFVHRLAAELDLTGFVGNDTEGVFIEVEGPPASIQSFERRLVDETPPLAVVYDIEARAIEPTYVQGFTIVESRADTDVRTFVSPDTAVCDECLAEMLDPGDRRFRYPFINCTNCGPRFTITVALPYDRPNTTMAAFAMCSSCSAEYHDPLDRRFHAQPIACETCGPQVRFEGPSGARDGTDPAVAAAQRALADGQIVAVKGIGGYHLACDAANPRAIDELRRRKARPDKPLAVMVRDLEAARRLAPIDGAEAALLTSPQHPIVLVARGHDGWLLPGSVAPGSPLIGLFLPYSPLHHLLFHPVPGSDAPVAGTLVMTSGNRSDEPICYEDDDAKRRLDPVADAWLVHDRPIHVPCDDSVVRLDDERTLPIRRARGYAPLPVHLPFDSVPLLATGGELKNAFCLSSGRDAWMSQHLGDMGSLDTLAAYERSLGQFTRCYQVVPRRIVTDPHPGYQIHRWAEDSAGAPLDLVQHHHAHIAAVMAEHGVPVDRAVIGFAFDGTGYGSDGCIWGGEVLIATYARFERLAHLRSVPLPGGDATIRKPYRTALAHLWSAGVDWSDDLAPVAAASGPELAVIERQLSRAYHCVPTTSMGRLFDAVSSLLDLRHVVSYEGQAAIELETVATGADGVCGSYRFGLSGEEIDPAPVVRGVVHDVRAGLPTAAISAGFHGAVIDVITELARRAHRRTGIDLVALSGGVFQNALLARGVRRQLRGTGLSVLTHHLVPPNDGGLALGQAAVAASRHCDEAQR